MPRQYLKSGVNQTCETCPNERQHQLRVTTIGMKVDWERPMEEEITTKNVAGNTGSGKYACAEEAP